MTTSRRILLIIAAVIVAGLIITGIVFASFHNSLFKGAGSSAGTSAPTQSSADTSPVDGSSDSSGTSSSTGSSSSTNGGSSTSSGASANQASGTSTTIPSTGPSDFATITVWTAVLAGAAYGVTRVARHSLSR